MSGVKILYLDHSHDFSGGQISLLTLLSLLEKDKFQPLVALNPKARIMKDRLDSLQVPFVELNFDKITWYRPVQLLKFMLRVRRIIAERKIDIVHSNTFMSGVLMAALKPLIRRPLIFRARLAIEYHDHGLIDKLIYLRSDMILANSFYVQKTFVNKFGENGRIKTVYNPIIVEPIEYELTTPTKFVFAILGRIESIKRHLDIVGAVELLSKKGLDFSVWILGAVSSLDNGEYDRIVREQIKERNLESYFVWKGFVHEPMRFARTINACISCTLGEALSRSIFECQLHEIPVLAARSGGNIEIINDGKTGFFFNPADVSDLASKMEFLINCPDEQISDLKKSARNQALEIFHERNTVRQEEDCYVHLQLNKH